MFVGGMGYIWWVVGLIFYIGRLCTMKWGGNCSVTRKIRVVWEVCDCVTAN